MNRRPLAFLISVALVVLLLPLSPYPVVQRLQLVHPVTIKMNAEKISVAHFEPLAFSCNNVTEVPTIECEALVALYNSTNGANWANHTGWLATNTPCNWYGISCYTNHIARLDLGSNQLSGSIPPQLGNLANLGTFDVNRNQLSGSIPPEFGNLTNLDWLDLSGNQLSGSIPPQLGNLTNLLVFWLDVNQLSGSIPPQLGNLANLVLFSLSTNQLSGSIPPQLGNLAKVTGFDINRNQLSGSIPPEFGNLTNLSVLDLGNNQLSGNIPPQLGNLPNLGMLDLSGNQLSGALPGSLVGLPKLKTFYFNNTSLCEPLDPAFQAWLASIPNLKRTNVNCVALPVADFSASPLSGGAPLDVSFHNSSTGNITSCSWDYGDGQTENSCAADHNHIYTAVGSYTVQLTVSGPGGSNTKTRGNYITVAAPSVNHPPVANNQNVTTAQNTAINITLTASDADGDPLTYILVSNPDNGTLSGTAPNLAYTPNGGFSGSDSFMFKANDGKVDSNIATVTITVMPPQGNNLIPNPSFEEPDPHDPTKPAFWRSMCGGSGGWDNSTAHTGTHSAQTCGDWQVTVTLPNPPPDYTFSVWHKDSGNCVGVGVLLEGFDEDGSVSAYVSPTLKCSGGWTKDSIVSIPLSQSFSVVGKPTHTLRISLQPGIPVVTTWWDDVKLVPASAPPKPLPVVLVHGWNDNYTSWDTYLKFLQSIGLEGYAIKSMYTGDGGGNPLPIDTNAQRLRDFIIEVKQETHAEQVDIVAHSMGGLIARRYIQQYMNLNEPDVHQLIMLGTPNQGSYTAVANQLAWYLGLRYNPSSVELTPYSVTIFNFNNNNHRNIPFYAIAGNYFCRTKSHPINLIEPLPNDIAVSTGSALGIPLDGGWIFPGLVPGCEGDHRGMRSNAPQDGGQEIFNRYVAPLLQGNIPEQADVQTSNIYQSINANPQIIDLFNQLQFTEIQTNILQPGTHLVFTQPSESTSHVNFIVIGPPEQMTVSLRDPNGQVITPNTNDPAIQYNQMDKDVLPSTSYTISNPVSGVWTTMVDANAQTPAEGTRIAVLRSLTSDLRLSLLPTSDTLQIHHAVTILAQLQANSTPITGATVSGSLVNSNGATSAIVLFDDGQHNDNAPNDGIYGYQFTPITPGVYSASISAEGINNNIPFHRISIWAVQINGNQIFLPMVLR